MTKTHVRPDCMGCTNAVCDECDSNNGWVTWPEPAGSKVALDLRSTHSVEVCLRDGRSYIGPINAQQWVHSRYESLSDEDSDDDIVAYRLVVEHVDVRKPSTNPKDAIGAVKLPLHLWPAEATAMGCLGMLEGACKYGRNNYVAGDGVIASIYVDAAKRHLDAWYSGEEFNPDLTFNEGDGPVIGVSHLANALACLAIIVKAQANGKLIDDRDFAPTNGYRKLVERITPLVKKIKQKFSDKSPKHYTIADNPKEGQS